MTDKERWMDVWAPSLGSVELAEKEWAIKLERERNPIRSARVYVMQSYQSPVTGKWIDSPSQRRDDLARTNSRPWEGRQSEQKEADRRTANLEKMIDKSAEESAVAAWHSLPDESKKALGA